MGSQDREKESSLEKSSMSFTELMKRKIPCSFRGPENPIPEQERRLNQVRADMRAKSYERFLKEGSKSILLRAYKPTSGLLK
jgi:hypothetical protein